MAISLPTAIKEWGGIYGIDAYEDSVIKREYETAIKRGEDGKAEKILQTMRRIQAGQQSPVQPTPYPDRENRDASLADLRFRNATCYPRFEDLNDSNSVHNMPVESVRNIWTARFGSGWTKDSDTGVALKDDRHFWKQVFYKLRECLECCEYQQEDGSRSQAWRLKEDHGNN